MKKLLLLLLCVPLFGLGQEKVEYKFSCSGLTAFDSGGYISFNQPIGCEEVKDKDLPSSAPEGTLCIYFCNNDMIMFKVTPDFGMKEEEIKNSKFINDYIKGIQSTGEIEVIKTNYTKINDVPALKTIAKYHALDMEVLMWLIFEDYYQIEVSAYVKDNDSKDFIEKIANSVSYSLMPMLDYIQFKIK